ncbi:MAG: winged helix-turn-helix domain-containing protein [Verrucomicrobiota bacterium]
MGKDPRQYGFDFGLWTRRIVQQLILEKLKVELCLTSVGKLLARLSIMPQKSLGRAYERDPQAVALSLAQTYPQLKGRASRIPCWGGPMA